MGIYDGEVQTKIGQNALEVLFEAVESNIIDEQKMADVAQNLHPSVSGNHVRRAGSGGHKIARDGWWAEMREVLSDWYKEELFADKFGQQEALERLISIFNHRDINLPELAKKLEACLPSSGAESHEVDARAKSQKTEREGRSSEGHAAEHNIYNTFNTYNNHNTYNTTIINQIVGDPELKGLLEGEGRAEHLDFFKEYLQQSGSTAALWGDISEVRKLIRPIALLTKETEEGTLFSTAFLAKVDGTTVLFGGGHCP